MKKVEKRQVEEFLTVLGQVHAEVKKALETDKGQDALELLAQCQQGVVEIGNRIENAEGNICRTIPLFEDYCEQVYQIYQEIAGNGQLNEADVYAKLCHLTEQMKESVENDISTNKEAVFLPYKASMWDSMESVWKAAEADPSCDAYVIPIPYYDKNPDGSFKKEYYEGDLFPDYVPITKYDAFDFESHRPDVIFIHNPYDDWNYVTSVHPFFYSSNIKKYTEKLVYIPYYATTGGMSEAQMSCPAYYHADYIIIQEEKYRKFFDPDLPAQKLLPLGSPKFDRVIHMCVHPPKPPAEWERQMKGKKVYFYNTSLGGMLGNTEAFLKKMEYVFRCFENRQDACLVWRPHPLMESSFDSMRKQYKPFYDALKQCFIRNHMGIYDDTPDIANTIALCDAYIGDDGTSVTSLFGIVGKPLFILDNNIHTKPERDDWRGKTIKGFYPYANDEWIVTQGNKLYHSEGNNYQYRYFCDLNDYSGGDYYLQVLRIDEKDYVCPCNAQDILIIGQKGIEERICLEECIEQGGAFYGAIGWKHYLFLIPNNYPYLVRLDTYSHTIDYWDAHKEIHVGTVQGERRIGGFCVQNGYLFLTSPVDNKVVAIDTETGKSQILTTGASNDCGCILLASDGEDLWFLPYTGTTVTRWNPESGMMREYSDFPADLSCTHPVLGYDCMDRPFSFPAFVGDKVYLAPAWGNKYFEIDRSTHEIKEWKTPFQDTERPKNGYFTSWQRASFVRPAEEGDHKTYLLFTDYDRKLYKINPETGEWTEIEIGFDTNELRTQEPGFWEVSQWFQYGCMENEWNSLEDFLNGTIWGNEFDRSRQIKDYAEIAANPDGTSGEKIYQFMMQ